MSPDIEFYIDGERMSTGSGVGKRLRFDRSTNTSYSERILLGRADMPKADTIEIVINHIHCYEHSLQQARRAFAGEWVITVNASDLGIQPIVWTDIQLENIHIEYMSLSPFGIRLAGTLNYDANDHRNFPVVEFEGRRRNYRFSSSVGSFAGDSFTSFSFARAPIDINSATAVIIYGERIVIP